MNGPKLGRPLKDPVVDTQQKRLERQESGERNAVEGKFGEGERFCGLGRVMTRLPLNYSRWGAVCQTIVRGAQNQGYDRKKMGI